ncbi:hypothetical protein vseg_015137 [Gypsophila vaccaria]
MTKQFPNDSSKNVFYNNECTVDDNVWEEESSSVVESSTRESSLIDLKLGGIGGDNLNLNSDSCRGRAPSSESSTPVRRVYDCNKDLSSAKKYHKRHKVCDAHSKTSKVVVNGIEQRFCQ